MSMTKEEKIDFINEITKNISHQLICNINSIPEEWNGKELRHLILERTKMIVWGDNKKPTRNVSKQIYEII